MPAARSSASPDPTADPAASLGSLPVDSEWLLNDGRGGYACGTVGDLVMRRYHGLWIARLPATAKRSMVVAGLDERVQLPDADADADAPASLMHAHWRSLPEPSPPAARVRFAHRPLPQWVFATEVGELERTVALRRAGDGDSPPVLLVRWRNRSANPMRLAVRPLLGCCDVDHLPPADDSFDGTVHARGASWGFRPRSDFPSVWLSVDGVAAFRSDPAWYRGFLYGWDRARGYDHVGDRWSPGVLELDLAGGADAIAAFALDAPWSQPAAAFEQVAAAAATSWAQVSSQPDARRARLALGADDFFYRAPGNSTDDGRLGVLAGFPWFGEWGRDVFLALPGLSLARGRPELCAEVLRGAVPFLRRGLLPNIFGRDPASSHYGSCDAALWFATAVMRYADGGYDDSLVADQLLPALIGIATPMSPAPTSAWWCSQMACCRQGAPT